MNEVPDEVDSCETCARFDARIIRLPQAIAEKRRAIAKGFFYKFLIKKIISNSASLEKRVINLETPSPVSNVPLVPNGSKKTCESHDSNVGQMSQNSSKSFESVEDFYGFDKNDKKNKL